MDKRLLDTTNSFVKDIMKATSKELSSVQGSPIGKESRSKKEFATIITDLMKLPREERQIKLVELANLSGHQGDKLDDCDMCKFITQSMLGK